MQGELVRLGHRIAASTVWQILHDAGIDLARRRSGPSWRQFIAAQAKAVPAVDFVHVDTMLLRGVSSGSRGRPGSCNHHRRTGSRGARLAHEWAGRTLACRLASMTRRGGLSAVTG